MSETTRNRVIDALLILLLANLAIPVMVFLFPPQKAEAQTSTATYTETWDALNVAVTKLTPSPINSPFTYTYYAGLFCYNFNFADISYDVIPIVNLSSRIAANSNYAFGYGWGMSSSGPSSSAAHGFVTKWQVTGTLSQ